MELAELVGITQKHMSHVETGFKNPSVPLLARIAKIFNTTMDVLNDTGTEC